MTVIDENRIPVVQGVSNADGKTILPVYANPVTHALGMTAGLGGSDLSGDVAQRDENRKVAFMAVSAVDGVTPVEIYVDSTTNKLLAREL